jgi:riboflavin synthase
MFAGIVRGAGRVVALNGHGGDRALSVALGAVDLGELAPGDSVAVNGVCLTVTACDAGGFTADVSRETLAVTTIGSLRPGDPVNLEPSLRLGDPIDGHLVYGHVDGVGRVASVSQDARSLRLRIEVPTELGRYLATKGSVAVDGVSLTVNAGTESAFEANIIPHTASVTIISGYVPGTPVNIEVDMIARYVERLSRRGQSAIDLKTLERHGFVSHE